MHYPSRLSLNGNSSSAPTWESNQKWVAAENKLLKERDQLHDYQKSLDEAREAAGKGDVTADALTRMEARLQKDMPDTVKAQLPGATAEQNIPSLQGAPPASFDLSKAQFLAYAPAGP